MNPLSIEVLQRPCAFVLHIIDPGETLRRLSLFFQDRHLVIEQLVLHRYPSGDAQVIFHCLLERDRISRTVQLLEGLPGVIKVQKMEGR